MVQFRLNQARGEVNLGIDSNLSEVSIVRVAFETANLVITTKLDAVSTGSGHGSLARRMPYRLEATSAWIVIRACRFN